MTEQDKHIEEQLFRVFRKLCPQFPAGDVTDNTDDDSPRGGPDFIVRTGSATLGVEITRLCLEGDMRGNARKSKESIWDRAAGEAQTRWLSEGHPQVDVRVLFNEKSDYGKRSAGPLADRLVVVVQEHLPEPGGIVNLPDANTDWARWPQDVRHIRIWRCPPEYGPQWFAGDVAWLPDLQPEAVQGVVDSKRENLVNYRRYCEKNWLLIGAGVGGLSSYFRSVAPVTHHTFTTGFDRVFLLELAASRLQELCVAGVSGAGEDADAGWKRA